MSALDHGNSRTATYSLLNTLLYLMSLIIYTISNYFLYTCLITELFQIHLGGQNYNPNRRNFFKKSTGFGKNVSFTFEFEVRF